MGNIQKLGLIAGNGRFPFLILRQAIQKNIPVVVAAIKEETFPEIEEFASESDVSIHWIGLGHLNKLIRLFKRAAVTQVLMAGQVKHAKIFSTKRAHGKKWKVTVPDVKMISMLASLPKKNTQSLLEGVISVLENEGFEFVDSTVLLKSLLAKSGLLTRRSPNSEEQKDIEYGRAVAREITRLDVGQTIVVKSQAVVAVEAMEGTNETIRRAAQLVGGQRLTVVKVSRPDQDMRFDVPVIGLETSAVLKECNVSALSIDADKTLIIDSDEFFEKVEASSIAIVAE
mgnify:FL=1